MKAVVKFAQGKGNTELREIDIPKVGPDEALVEARAIGICSYTDVIGVYGGRTEVAKVPIVVGHEIAGVVKEIGQNVKGLKVGDRVCADTCATTCGTCIYCGSGRYYLCNQRKGHGYGADGVYAEYASIHWRMLHKIPKEISFEVGAEIQPLAHAVHTVVDRAHICPGDTVVVFGPDSHGLFMSQVAKAYGAQVIVAGGNDDAQVGLKVAKKVGIDITVNLAEEDIVDVVRNSTNGVGADVVIENAGDPAILKQGLRILRKQGQLVITGVYHQPAEIDIRHIHRSEITLTGSYTQWWPNFERAIKMLLSKEIVAEPLITHKLPLEDWEKGFRLVEKKEAVKVILYPK